MSSGRPPSYSVAIKKADGTLAFVGASNHPSDPRVSFNLADHIARYTDDPHKQVKSVNVMRFAHGGDRGDFLNARRQFNATDRPSYLFREALPE
jgi:hypothetical protein